MIGDLISILFLGVIWWRILKVKKNDFSRFLLEITIYFFVFVFTLLFYKLFWGINRVIFPEVLYPSVVGIFAISFISVYALLKLAIFLIDNKKPAWGIENRIYNFSIKIFNFFNLASQDFEKIFLVFLLINLVIIGTLSNSLIDAFSFKKKMYTDQNSQLLLKEQGLINAISENDNFKYNTERALEFMRLTNPYYYEQVVDNTERIALSNLGNSLARASSSDYSITFDQKYGERRFDKIKEYLALSTILVHESQHLKDYKMIDKGSDGFKFFAYIFGEVYFKIACNPITNYENFSHIFRATHFSFDEWCAQIEEVKFMRMYNVDYKNDQELLELFRK